jgi:hypothetical protein
VVVGCDPKHHRPNCWIVSFFGQRPHFFGSHAPVRWGLKEITRVGDALAPQNGLPKFTKKARIMRRSAPPPLKVAEARKSARLTRPPFLRVIYHRFVIEKSLRTTASLTDHIGMKRDRASIAHAKMSASGRDRKFSPEHRAKLSAAAKARKPPSAETIAKISAANRGRKQSPEAVAKGAAARRGLKRSPDAIAKTAAFWRGRKHSAETRAKLSAANRGKKLTAETRAKIASQGRARWADKSPEERAAIAGKVAKANRGRKFTHEHRAKLSGAATARERRRRARLLDGTVDALIDDIGADALDARLILSFASDTLEMAE